MALSCYCTILLSIFLLILVSLGINADSLVFEIKPRGDEQHEIISNDGVYCKFTCRAQGGTNEKWMITFEQIETSQEYICSVQRHEGKTTYLFFQEFKMETSGATVLEGSGTTPDNKPLRPDQFKMGKNYISYVEGTHEMGSLELKVKKTASTEL